MLKFAAGAAFKLGEKACGACILARAEDGSNQYGKEYNSISVSPYADTTNYFPVNPPQMVPGITECGYASVSLQSVCLRGRQAFIFMML